MKRLARSLLFLSVVCIVAGCGKPNAPPPTAKVSGTVNLDGKPMQGGEIRFELAGYGPKNLEITNGTFSGDVFVGKNRVDVVWDKDMPNPMDPKGPPVKGGNAVDPKFLGPNSPLNAEIPAGGKSDLKFDVTSARK